MLDTMSELFIYIYTVEMVLKILAMGFVFGAETYLRDPWNQLDFVIVGSAWLGKLEETPAATTDTSTTTADSSGNDPASILPVDTSVKSSGGGLAALRSLRILRPLKTIAKSQDLKVILQAIFSSIPMLMNILIVLTFFILVMAIAGLQLFKGKLLL